MPEPPGRSQGESRSAQHGTPFSRRAAPASWSLIIALGLAKFLAVEIEKWILRLRGVRSL